MKKVLSILLCIAVMSTMVSCRFTVSVNAAENVSFSDAKTILLNAVTILPTSGGAYVNESVSITAARQIRYFKFVPTSGGTYVIESSGGSEGMVDPYGYLYNASQSLIDSDDDAAGGRNFKITYTLTVGATYYIGAGCYGSGTGSYTIKVTPPGSSNNISIAIVKTIALNTNETVNVTEANQKRYYKFVPATTGSYTIESSGGSTSGVDPYGYLYNSSQSLLISDDDSAGSRNFRITYTLTAGTTYHIASGCYGSGTGSYTIKITQGTTTLNVNLSTLSLAESGASVSVSVISNISWTVSSSAASWLTVSPSSGSNNGNFTITAAANTGTTLRTGTITVIGVGITRTISVTQAASANLTLSISSWNPTSSYSSTTVNVTSNTTWTVSSNVIWLTRSVASGSNNGSFTITAAANTSTAPRTGTITVTGGGITKTISVTQQFELIPLDSDGDGIPNSWESYGVDFDGDGIIDLPLHLMGADPNKKDVFVEIDWMTGFQPVEISIKPIYEEFKKHNINLHIDFGPDSIDYVTGKKWKDYPGGSGANVFAYSASDQYPNGNMSIWTNIINNNLTVSRRKVFHHSAFVANLGGAGGYGNWPGQHTLVLGTMPSWAIGAAFMHELGHNLGLGHGGMDGVNHKPNYLSNMNYMFSYDSTLCYKYSDYKLLDLNELSLNESNGVDPNGLTAGTNYPTGFMYYENGQPKKQEILIASRTPIDFNLNGKPNDANISVDVNCDGVRNTMRSQNDWENLVFKSGSIGFSGAAESIFTPSDFKDVEIPDEPKIDELRKLGLFKDR